MKTEENFQYLDVSYNTHITHHAAYDFENDDGGAMMEVSSQA